MTYIQQGSPQEKGYSKCFDATLKDDLHKGDIFCSLVRGLNHHQMEVQARQYEDATVIAAVSTAWARTCCPNGTTMT